MMRSRVVLAVLALAGGCFSDPSGDETCNPGMEGCDCVDLQCEQGLTCMSGMCVVPSGSSGAEPVDATTTGGGGSTSTSTSTTTTTTDTSSTTTGGDDASSTAAETSSSTGSPDTCGDFEIGPTEECDGGNGCSDLCELEVHECNPLNDVPCPEDRRCSWELLMPEPFTGYYTCLPRAEEPLADGEGDCFEMNQSQDQLCDVGLACISGGILEGCEVDGCCTEYCDLEQDDTCTTEGYTCVAEPDLAPGLAFLGACRPG